MEHINILRESRSRKILKLLNLTRNETKYSPPQDREKFPKFSFVKEVEDKTKYSSNSKSDGLNSKINIINVVTLKNDSLIEDTKIINNIDLKNYSSIKSDNIIHKNNLEQFRDQHQKNDMVLRWLNLNENKTEISSTTIKTKEQFDVNSFSEKDLVSNPSIFNDSGSEYIPSHSGSESQKNRTSKNNFGIPYKSYNDLRKRNTNKEKINTVIKENIENESVLSKLNDIQESCSNDKVKGKNTSSEKRTIILNRVEENFTIENQIKDDKNYSTESSVDSESEENKEKVSIVNSKIDLKSGKRIRDKVHCCLFCEKLIINIARHYELLHENEIRVARILSMPKRSKARKEAFNELHKVSDFHHNCRVLNQNSGELILVRRPSKKELHCKLRDYGPCPNCLGFIIKKRIWFHLKYHCKVAQPPSQKNERKNIIAESTALLVGMSNNSYSQEYKTNILSKFQNDGISDICRTDEVILKFGWTLFEKFGMTQNDLIRQQMRQLGRFLLEIKNISLEITSLSDCLLPNNFDLVIDATKNLCGDVKLDTRRPEFKVPSLALKIGQSLKKCASILRGIALRKGLTKQNESYSSFLALMNMEWSSKISSRALSTLHKRKFNNKQLLPLTEDLVHLTKYLDKEMSELMDKIQNNVQYKTWRDLASITLTRVILFNKKRSGEAAKMTIGQYATRPTIKDNTQELLMSLSPLEKKLASVMEVIDIEGKRGSRVPVIITPKIKSAIDILIKTRGNVNISKKNPYIFCPLNTENGHLRGYECLKSACNEANLRQPKLITGTQLRKYVATVSQIFNLGENECDWLARHMGHDIRVHRNFYRLHENTIETTKISRLLLAIEKGQANKFAGKTLDEITVEDFPPLEEEEEEDDNEGEGNEVEVEAEETSNAEIANISENEEENIKEDDTSYKNLLNNDRKRKSVNPDSNIHNNKKKKNTVKSRQSTIKRPWSKEEVDAVTKFFKFELKKEFLPGKEKCLMCIEENSCLKIRKWTDIKYYLKNYYSKNKRLLEKSLE